MRGGIRKTLSPNQQVPLREGLPAASSRILKLARDVRGYPVPYFVAWIDGAPDFRVIDPDKYRACVRHRLCWICGEPLGRYLAFVIGPMSAVNRTSAEPPSHRDCAVFSATACPFLTRPKMARNEKGVEDAKVVAGVGLTRNPGVALVWITTSYEWFRDGMGGRLIRFGDPVELLWFAEGREAKRAEIDESIRTGLPHLEKLAAEQGPEAQRHLAAEIERMETLLP